MPDQTPSISATKPPDWVTRVEQANPEDHPVFGPVLKALQTAASAYHQGSGGHALETGAKPVDQNEQRPEWMKGIADESKWYNQPFAHFREGLDRMTGDLQDYAETHRGVLTPAAYLMLHGVAAAAGMAPIGRTAAETGVAMATPPELGGEARLDVSDVHRAATDAGVEYRGLQEGASKADDVLIFQDPQSKTSVAVKRNEFSPEKLAGHVADARSRMATPTAQQTVAVGGTGAISSEELARPEVFAKYNANGRATYQGKQPDATLKPGEAVLAINPKTGAVRVQNTNGLKDEEALAKFGAHAKENFGPQDSAPKLPPIRDNYRKDLSKYTDTLHHETSIYRALEMMPIGGVSADQPPMYFSNTPELATGQGMNRGVHLQFDSNGIEGQVNLSKPMAQAAYDQGSAEFLAKDSNQRTLQKNLKSITIDKDAVAPSKGYEVRFKNSLSALEKQGWTKKTNENGSVTYERPKLRQNTADNESMSDPDVRFNAARHEAGHAVVSELLRPGSVNGVSLDEHGGLTEIANPPGVASPSGLTPDQVKDMVAMSYAGGLQEEGGTTAKHVSSDVGVRQKLLGPQGLNANEDMAAARARVTALLVDPANRTKIDQVAKTLNTKGKLTGDDVRKIVGGK